MLFRLGIRAPVEQDGPQVVVRVGVLIVDREHLAVAGGRVVQAPLLLIDETQVVSRIDPFRAEAERTLELVDRLGQFAALHEGASRFYCG